jgi:integrase/recombinase XerC
LNYLRYERNYSDCTVQSYDEDLKAFESYFKNSKEHALTWESVDSDIIRDWMEHMMDKGNNATSINRRLSALRSFYRYALIRGLVERNPARSVQGPKKERPLPQFVREEEMRWLLDDYEWDDSYNNVCARTIIELFYETGVRVSELTGLDDVAVDTENCQVKVTGKRDKQRVVPFGERMRERLTAYRQLRNQQVVNAESEAFFLTEKGRRWKNEQVARLVKKYLSLATTLKKKSPHVLRHTFATAMLNHDAGLESVKKLLGHERLTTTEIYTHTTFEQLKRVYEQAHPRG